MRIGSLQTYMSSRQLLQRTYAELVADDGLGLAAQLAYYFFLALFPTLLFLLALASFFPVGRFTDLLPETVGRFAAPEMVQLLREQLQQISNAGDGGILSLGLPAATAAADPSSRPCAPSAARPPSVREWLLAWLLRGIWPRARRRS